MKKMFSKIIVFFIVLISAQTYAQYYNSNPGGGVDRRIGRQNTNGVPSKKEPVDYAKIMLDDITNTLKLDGFQNAIVKNLITDYLKNANEIASEPIPEDAKMEKTLIARTKMEDKFTEIFTEKQKILFQEMKDKNSGKKKSKKSKNNDKDSE